jgi:RNA polymerase sigma factor (sigma-70 family)
VSEENVALCENQLDESGRVVAGFELKVVPMLSRERRPPVRAEVDEAALRLLARHGSQVLATARRYAATPEDAEDAYQRAFEILLTKAPTTREEELVPWLKTVVKHEAFALRRQRDRHSPVTDDGELGDRGTSASATHDQVERMERLHQGAEALRQLKPQEMRALLLKAEGYSYAEIAERTGWSYTKVNRCLTEGRQALAVRVAGIETGVECAGFAPLLSALADGEASAEQLARLRPHMKTCLSCRSRLKEFRAAPARVAALVPPVALAGAATTAGGPRGLWESLLGAAQHKAAALGERTQAAVELATGQKVAAVAASAAALAGGGTAVDQLAQHESRRPAPAPPAVEAEPVKDEIPATPAPEPAPVAEPPAAPAPEPTPAPAPAPEPAAPPPPPDPATEFAPTAAPRPAPQPAATPVPASPADGFAPAGGGNPGGDGSDGGAAGNEFGP